MQEEILNIEFHVKRMCLLALNRTLYHKDAADLLGITDRTLYRYRKNFGIKFDKKKDLFYLKIDRPDLKDVIKQL